MDDALRMRSGQCIGQLPRDFNRFLNRHRAALQTRRQRLAFHVLEDDGDLAVDVEDVVDGGDVRMIERGGGARFAHQPLAAFDGLRIGALDRLQRDFSIEARILGQPHHAHAAGTELAENAIRPNRCADVHE